MNARLVSVVIPTYNRSVLLRQALQSVLAQSYDALDVIIADDGSQDDSLKQVALLAERYRGPATIRVAPGSHCGYPGAVRNRGVALARGTLIAFLDDDDLWHPQKLEHQLAHHCACGAVLSHTRERWLRRGHEVSQARQRHRRSGNIFDDALRKCIIGPSTVMIDRSLLQQTAGFREDLRLAEDYELWLRITSHYPVAWLDEALTIKRSGYAPQLSTSVEYIEHYRINALRPLIDKGYFSGEQQRAARVELARKCTIHAMGAAKRGRTLEATEYHALAAHYSISVDNCFKASNKIGR